MIQNKEETCQVEGDNFEKKKGSAGYRNVSIIFLLPLWSSTTLPKSKDCLHTDALQWSEERAPSPKTDYCGNGPQGSKCEDGGMEAIGTHTKYIPVVDAGFVGPAGYNILEAPFDKKY